MTAINTISIGIIIIGAPRRIIDAELTVCPRSIITPAYRVRMCPKRRTCYSPGKITVTVPDTLLDLPLYGTII